MKKQLISIVIPVRNEEQNIPLVYEGIAQALRSASNYDYEFIFVDDGSDDASLAAIEKLTRIDPRVKLVEFVRNFGKEMATTAGVEAARGAAVMLIDADLQHPPSLIPEFIKKWEQGGEAVVGIRRNNPGAGLIKGAGSWLFYAITAHISQTAMEPGETDFRLLDRIVADAFKSFPERRRTTRFLVNWLGFKKAHVYFDAPRRIHGASQFSFGKLVHMALYSFVSNSLLPLRLAGYLGLTIAILAGVLGLVVFFERYVFNDALKWGISGSAQLAIIDVFLIGIVLMALGIMALYIENIHVEAAARPLYVVRKRVNFEVPSSSRLGYYDPADHDSAASSS